jgi:hypothetical protein
MKPEDEIQPADQTTKHSRYGIASFLICCFFIVAAEIRGWDLPFGGVMIWAFVMLIFIVLFVGLIPLVGLVLGLVGLRQQNFRKQFCKLGIGLNGIPLFFGGGFLLLKYFGIAF